MSINPKLLSRLAIVPPASAALVGLVVLAGRWMTGLWADWSLVWQLFALYVVIGPRFYTVQHGISSNVHGNAKALQRFYTVFITPCKTVQHL